MAHKRRDTKLPAPYLQRVFLNDPDAPRPDQYPFDLPWLDAAFELTFDTPVTILVGENGSGKSTLLESIAVLAGFSTSSRGAWSGATSTAGLEGSAALAGRLRGAWLPKVQQGWFLKAQSFAAVADVTVGGYLSQSHGEGFAAMIQDRMTGQGIFLLDEPEAALSPRKQAELLAFLAEIQEDASAQVIMATHSPILMAVPKATLLRLTHRGITRVGLRETEHFSLWASFAADPDGFVQSACNGELDLLT
ncbi:ATP-binding protein [Tateyamaria omphalii]|uniref:AAA family ATPase n=1 Tax=Tateyamaria omphalii TaxID=299262 RepID=UPI0016759122|nr:AAA family ATPase [Tateyamaria omphalii]GGX53838.1 ATP-binding protein [Tateyamaria omphalii]